jgi:murein DD-endopeptidase MepM/ murein hydrolase activator NlpD
MKKIFLAAIFIGVVLMTLRSNFNMVNDEKKSAAGDVASGSPVESRAISGNIRKGETLFDIFRKYHLDVGELFKLREASADVHRLRDLYPDRPYKIVLDRNDKIASFVYWIDDDTILNISSTDSGYSAEKIPVKYEKRIEHIGGIIKDNLVSSMGEERGDLMLALQLSDIFAWDIDFTTDLRNNDVFKIVVEGLYLNGKFKKYGDILSAEFINNGVVYHAYRFENNGKADYYNDMGQSLRRTFLKAPLSFRRISSAFTSSRFHPILKIYRPHHGLDYAAPTGTPVSVSGDGTVIFAGRKGGYGNLVIVRHRNNYKTYYGHLSRIRKGIGRGAKVAQGQLIGYVGATGIATGPHLHYEMRINDKAVNPLSVKIPHGKAIPLSVMAEFRNVRDTMESKLASIPGANFMASERNSGGTNRGNGETGNVASAR